MADLRPIVPGAVEPVELGLERLAGGGFMWHVLVGDPEAPAVHATGASIEAATGEAMLQIVRLEEQG